MSKVRALVTLEIEIDEDISKKYPNFIWNYKNKEDFIRKQISILEHNIKLEDSVLSAEHPAYKEEYDYDFFDDGYKQTIKSFKTFRGDKLIATNEYSSLIINVDTEFSLDDTMSYLNTEDWQEEIIATINFIDDIIADIIYYDTGFETYLYIVLESNDGTSGATDIDGKFNNILDCINFFKDWDINKLNEVVWKSTEQTE
ncbi:hypothetical protein [Aliarcobacter butzleri]|uniref:hypothetical protein n=1 Tax=Aliarcobacter butzleri TaxID=28197 RepID=UPI00126A6B75|nr:hypothetical protein [Aliarcobacter butzleri]